MATGDSDSGRAAENADYPRGKPRTRLAFHSDELAYAWP